MKYRALAELSSINIKPYYLFKEAIHFGKYRLLQIIGGPLGVNY